MSMRMETCEKEEERKDPYKGNLESKREDEATRQTRFFGLETMGVWRARLWGREREREREGDWFGFGWAGAVFTVGIRMQRVRFAACTCTARTVRESLMN
jgi:hypothetical protein